MKFERGAGKSLLVAIVRPAESRAHPQAALT
jgi:hypothetical protein